MPRNDDNHDNPRGVSLARGPALILGTVLLIAGLYFLYRIHTFPKLSHFPSGRATVDGKAFLGIFGVNGWSGELTAAAGGALLFGAAQHLLAKTMSLIVGIVLAVVAVIALVHHHSALGLFAANIWTVILWAGSAIFLLLNTLMPRHRAHREPAATPPPPRQRVTAVRSADAAPVRDADSAAGQTDGSTIIPERGAVRVRPGDGSAPGGSDAGAS